MSGQWQITNRQTGGAAAASASQAAPSGPVGTRNRLRSLWASGTGEFVVRDGATGSGTIIWSADLSSSVVFFDNLDLRASTGNAITVEFTSASGTQDVNAGGDWVVPATPYGAQG